MNQNKPCQYSRVVTARASRWSTIIHMNRHVCQLWLTDDTIHMSNLSLSLTLSRFSKNVFGIQRLINAIGYQYIWYIWLTSEEKLEFKCKCVFPDTFRISKASSVNVSLLTLSRFSNNILSIQSLINANSYQHV